jgi:hypothetical protein
MPDEKWQFIHSEILVFSIMASLQRANVYAPGASEEYRRRFRHQLRDALRDIGGRYARPVAGPEHEGNILELAERASRGCEDSLEEKHLRLGVAQKDQGVRSPYPVHHSRA